MTIYDLSCERPEGKNFGGKANTLGRLLREGFPVPPGLALATLPASDLDWESVFNWWNAQNGIPLAVRSSACGEDGDEYSFAGQHETILNVCTETELRSATARCFASIDQENARKYREDMGIEPEAVSMNALLQVMVSPKHAGVYFSRDPRDPEKDWLIEYVEGLGEDLVSGRVTPKVLRSTDVGTRIFASFQAVCEYGAKAATFLGYDLDMEWAIDEAGSFYILQCRPITTKAGSTADSLEAYIRQLNDEHTADTIWDGQAFAEWTGVPSTAGYSLWEKAYCPNQAFDKALRKLGYRGTRDLKTCEEGTLLDRIFGRPYVNLNRLMPVFYGRLPCRMAATPEPRLKFDARRLSPATIINVPAAFTTMFRVAWRMNTARGALIKECEQALKTLDASHEPYLDDEALPSDEVRVRLKSLYEPLVSDGFVWPLTLIMLVQSTRKMLETHLNKIQGKEQAQKTIQEWMSIGVHTEIMRMNEALQMALRHPEAQETFLACYGHRGPGELDIANPRWQEHPDKFFASMHSDELTCSEAPEMELVESQIHALPSFRKTLVAQEWALLRDMLELRERWKMSLMRIFSHIRSCMVHLGTKSGLNDDIFHLSLDEVLETELMNLNTREINAVIKERKSEQLRFTDVSLPSVLALRDLENLFGRGGQDIADLEQGEALSPGVSVGEVRIVVGDPSNADTSHWPTDAILVAESTDPGWTPLFSRVRGIVVEKGGVLSHCAIVAREMRIPAVGQISQCHLRFCDGDRIWVDGVRGTVRREKNV